MASATHQSLPSNRFESQYAQQGGFSQVNQRRKQRLTDQHGRKYFAVIEIRSGDPVGPIEPMFDAPLKVPAMYVRKHPDLDRPTDIVIDYPRWIGDLEAAWTERERRGKELARKTLGSAYDPTKELPSEILDILGPPPQPVEPVYAALQGNRWILGWSKRIDLRLARFFEPDELDPSRRQFNAAKYDFRDVEGAEDDALPDVTSEALAPAAMSDTTSSGRVIAIGEDGFDYAAAAATVDDGMDDLEMQLDEDDDLEAQFDKHATGGTRVPVGKPPKGEAPKTLLPPSTKRPGMGEEKEKPLKKGKARKGRPTGPTAPDGDLPPAA